jgi:CBS-domain-containing membrane protein
MSFLRDIQLLPASIDEKAPFLDAARRLLSSHTSALAVLDDDRRVVGLFTDDDLLRGLFPPYLEELRHTAFLSQEAEALQATAADVSRQSVDRYMRTPVTVDIDAAPAHVVERFLHTPWGALAVLEHGRFVGILGQLEFTERLLGRLDLA